MNQLLRVVLVGLAGLSFFVASIFVFTLSAGGSTLAIALYGICALCLSTLALLNMLTEIRDYLKQLTQQQEFKQMVHNIEQES